MLNTGDLLFHSGTSWISRLIRWVTGGRMSHVGLIYSPDKVFETNFTWVTAKVRPLSGYKGKKITCLRLKTIVRPTRDKIVKLCDKYNGFPYSYWDCAANFIGAPLPEKMRKKFVAAVGNKRFAKCDEISMRILWEATGYAPFKQYESHTPNSLYKMCKKSRDFVEVER